MNNSEHVPMTPDDAVVEIASILAKGYLRHRKGRHIAADTVKSPHNLGKVTESVAVTENELDASGHHSRCSTAS
jgi:hypothetical protein